MNLFNKPSTKLHQYEFPELFLFDRDPYLKDVMLLFISLMSDATEIIKLSRSLPKAYIIKKLFSSVHIQRYYPLQGENYAFYNVKGKAFMFQVRHHGTPESIFIYEVLGDSLPDLSDLYPVTTELFQRSIKRQEMILLIEKFSNLTSLNTNLQITSSKSRLEKIYLSNYGPDSPMSFDTSNLKAMSVINEPHLPRFLLPLLLFPQLQSLNFMNALLTGPSTVSDVRFYATARNREFNVQQLKLISRLKALRSLSITFYSGSLCWVDFDRTGLVFQNVERLELTRWSKLSLLSTAFPKLRELSVECCFAPIFEVVYLPDLRRLSFEILSDEEPVRPEFISELVRKLGYLGTLQELSMVRCGLTNSMVTCLCEKLKQLQTLDLRDNQPLEPIELPKLLTLIQTNERSSDEPYSKLESLLVPEEGVYI